MSSLSAELAYITRVAGQAPAMPVGREVELAKRFRESGDRRAADLLARSQLRMVIALALKYRHYGVPVSDLVAEGNCGLVAALHKFDPERGVRLGTYAKHWVRSYILACVIRSSNPLGGRTGLPRRRLFFKLRRERARITALLGEGVAAEEALAKRLELNVDELRRQLDCLECRSVSLDSVLGSDGFERLTDALDSTDNPEEQYFRGRQNDVAASAVTNALQGLDERERFIAEHRLLASDSEELSLAQIARTWGLSPERVRQLEERARQKLERSSAIVRDACVHEWFTD